MCSECARNQGARFPIGASRRAPVGTTGAALREEQPLLLDPCDPQDAPEARLTYLDDGRIASETERGQVTIEVFGLNRASLLAARPLADERVRAEWASFASGEADAPTLTELVAAHHEFAGLRRQR